MASTTRAYNSYRIEHLTNTNYRTWAVRMQMILVREDLWNHVNGTTRCPIPIYPANAAPNAPPTNQADITAWQQLDAKAISDIILSIGDRQVDLVHRLPTSREIWERLKLIYEHSDIASQVSAHRRLVNHSLQESASVPNFLEEWQGFLDEATTAGLQFSDSQVVTMLLSALPPTWSSFVTTQGTVANLTLPILIGRILQEDTMHKNSRNNSTSTSSTAPLVMFAKGSKFTKGVSWQDRASSSKAYSPSSSRSQSPSTSSRSSSMPPSRQDIECTYCHKRGHYKADCWKYAFDRQKAKQNTYREESNFAQEEGDDNSDYDNEVIGLHF